MKIGIVGSSGYIAGFLLRQFEEEENIQTIVKIDRSNHADLFLDLEKVDDFDFDLLLGIDYIIFTAAISGPDMCATEFEKCWNINVVGTSRFIKEAIDRGIKVIFFSSDAVFGDIPGEIYNEKSQTNAVTPYGRMKKAIEDKFKGESNFKAIRLSYVASAKDRFVSYCLKCIDSGEIAEVFHPFYRNCIVVSDVIMVVSWLIDNWSNFPDYVLNVAGLELVSRVRIADEVNRIKENQLKYTIVRPPEDFYSNRPETTQMDSLYLYELGILPREKFTKKIKREMERG